MANMFLLDRAVFKDFERPWKMKLLSKQVFQVHFNRGQSQPFLMDMVVTWEKFLNSEDKKSPKKFSKTIKSRQNGKKSVTRFDKESFCW